MSGNRLFVDTNILLYFLKGATDVVELISDKELTVSVITEIELLSFPQLTSDSQSQIKDLLKECHIVELNEEIKDLTIEFRKKYKLKIPDAMVTASAYTKKIPLFTGIRNSGRLMNWRY